MRLAAALVLALCFSLCPLLARAAGSTTTGTITGTVTSSGAPIAGADVIASGPQHMVTKTDAKGAFSLTLEAGLYRISVEKGGYVPAAQNDVAVFIGETLPLAVNLEQADLSSLRTIATVQTSSRGSSINTGAASISYLPAAQIAALANPQINDVIQRLPNATIQKMGSQPDTTIVLGGVQPYETQVLIDGHPLSMGQFGVWLSEYFASSLLGGVETQVGPGNTTPFANTAVGGTANLLTPGFTAKPTFNFVIGTDTYGSQYTNMLFTGKQNHFSYVGGLGYGSSNGPYFRGNECVVNPTGDGVTGTIQFCGDSSGSLFTKGEILKVKYDFSPVTSFELGFIGSQGGFQPQGTSYGQFLGNLSIVPCGNSVQLTNPGTGGGPQQVCTNPANANLIGKTIPAYTWYPGSNVYSNQPIFTAQFRTSIGKGTLLLRPYAGNIERILDGAHEDEYPLAFSPPGTVPGGTCAGSAPGSTGNCFEQACANSFIGQITGFNATPTVINGMEECYQTQFSEFEQDKLYGNTLTYLLPVGDNLFSLNYDFHGDSTYGYYNANVPADVTVPSTYERYTTLSLTGDVHLNQAVSAKVGLYGTRWNLNGVQAVPNATPDPVTGAIPTMALTRSVSRFDPHIALTWQPKSNLALRAAFGTSETFPFSGYVSGSSFFTPQSNTYPGGFVTRKNPFLAPETSSEFSLGADYRLKSGGIVTLDMQNTSISNVFEQVGTPNGINVPGLGPVALLQPINAANLSVQMATLKYNYAPKLGFGGFAALTVERSVTNGIPNSYYAPGPTLPANGVQTCGFGNATPGSVTCIPYMKGYGQLTYTFKHGTWAGLGVDFEGKNNTYFQPPFAQWDLSVRQPLREDLEAQISVQNLFNTNNFQNLPQPGAGVSTPVGTLNGGNFALTSVGSSLIPAPPRTFRFQLRWHTGRP